MDQEEIKKAKNKAFQLLSYRERTIQEMRDRLEKKDFSLEVIDEVINYLLDKDLLNEKRFSEMWIRSRINNHPRGRRLIYRELRKKGIEKTIINAALNEYLSREEELKMARYLSNKWLRRRKEEDSSSYKLKNYLSNKGFEYEIIFEVTDK